MYIILLLVVPAMIYYIVRDAVEKGIYEVLIKYEQHKNDKI